MEFRRFNGCDCILRSVNSKLSVAASRRRQKVNGLLLGNFYFYVDKTISREIELNSRYRRKRNGSTSPLNWWYEFHALVKEEIGFSCAVMSSRRSKGERRPSQVSHLLNARERSICSSFLNCSFETRARASLSSSSFSLLVPSKCSNVLYRAEWKTYWAVCMPWLMAEMEAATNITFPVHEVARTIPI